MNKNRRSFIKKISLASGSIGFTLIATNGSCLDNKNNTDSNNQTDFNVIPLLNKYSKENTNYIEVTKWHDETQMNDSKVDSFIYIKHNGKYYVDSDFYNGKVINVAKFGVLGTDEKSNTSGIINAIQFCKKVVPCTLVFNNKVYDVGDIGNLAVSGLNIIGQGSSQTILKTSKSGIAFNFNGFENSNSNTPFCQKMNVRFIGFEGNNRTTAGLYLHGLARCTWEDVSFKEAGAKDSIAFHMQGVQLSQFHNIHCSTDLHTMRYIPTEGLRLEAGIRAKQSVGNSSNNSFYDIQMEGLTRGIMIAGGDQNIFVCGTSESNKQYGLVISQHSRYNTFINTGFEHINSTDVSDAGLSTRYINCYSSYKFILQGENITIDGGFHEKIQIDSDARYCEIRSLYYNYFNTKQGGIINNGKMTKLESLIDKKTNKTFSESINTLSRPTDQQIGYNFFDTKIKKPIWYQGNGVWVDANGNKS